MSLLIDVALFVGLMYILLKLYQKWAIPEGYPPGPTVLPVVGTIFSLGMRPHETFLNWRSKYGDTIGLKMGSRNTVALNNLDLIREAYNMEAFSGATLPEPLEKIMTSGKYGGLIFSEGKDWSEQRRFALRNLRDLGFGKKSMEGMAHEDVNVMIESLKADCGKPIIAARRFTLSVLNSLWHIVAGERFELDDPKFKEVVDKLGATQDAAGPAGAALLIPWLAELIPDFCGLTKFRESVAAVKVLLQSHIDEHKKTFQADSLRDFMDVYLKEINSTTDQGSSFYGEKGAGNLLVACMNLFEAGAETSSATLNWTLYYLSKDLNIQKELQDEIDSVVGKFRLPSLNDRPNMPYTEGVMLEVFRISSLAPLGVPHRTMSDVVFHGFKIPKDTDIFANLYGRHHDPKIWEDPETFRPARFLTEDGKGIQKGHPPVIPFSLGKRACLGETLARNNFFLFFTSIFQRFSVTRDPNSNEGKEPMTFLRAPPEYKVIFEDRLDSK